MTEKNKMKLELKRRRENMGKLWNGYKPLTTKTKKEKIESIIKKHKHKDVT